MAQIRTLTIKRKTPSTDPTVILAKKLKKPMESACMETTMDPFKSGKKNQNWRYDCYFLIMKNTSNRHRK